jgi:Skp family chaperone for outer membrane proteins
MESAQIYQVIATAVSVLAVVAPFLWKASKIWTTLESEVVAINKHLKGIEKDLDEMKRGLVEARSGRTNLWNELNTLKERNTRLSTIVQLKSEKCPQ